MLFFSQENLWVYGLLEFGFFAGEEHEVHVLGERMSWGKILRKKIMKLFNLNRFKVYFLIF